MEQFVQEKAVRIPGSSDRSRGGRERVELTKTQAVGDGCDRGDHRVRVQQFFLLCGILRVVLSDKSKKCISRKFYKCMYNIIKEGKRLIG